MKTLTLNLLPLNLARFSDACQALGLDPDDVRTGEAAPEVSADLEAVQIFTKIATGEELHGDTLTAAARLGQLGERRSSEREVASSNPGRTNTQGLKNN